MKLFFLLLLTLIPLSSQELNLAAPNANFDFVDQKGNIGNSCGPASLLNAFGSGSAKWQKAFQKIPGSNDSTRIAAVINSWGLSPSSTLPNRKRWERRGGCNFVDLAAMAEDMRKLEWSLTKVQSDLFFAAPGQESLGQLHQAHKRLQKSLKKGLPPILSVRRFVFRKGHWQSVHGHFVVLTAMPAKLSRGALSFPIEFVDPIGAKSYRGQVSFADTDSGLPSLVLVCPSSSIGKPQTSSGERSSLGLTGAIGTW